MIFFLSFFLLNINLSAAERRYWFLPSSPLAHSWEVYLQEIPHKLGLMPQSSVVCGKEEPPLNIFVSLSSDYTDVI